MAREESAAEHFSVNKTSRMRRGLQGYALYSPSQATSGDLNSEISERGASRASRATVITQVSSSILKETPDPLVSFQSALASIMNKASPRVARL